MVAEVNNETSVNSDAPAALYRRYRPTRLADLVGQEVPKAALAAALREGRVSHAYLFSGPRGCGKTSTARILAKVLNCESPVNLEPCDQCPSCSAITNGTSHDVREVDAASNSGVDAVRDLISTVAYSPYGNRKVYIIDEVHQLSASASNALLKTLEEPPPHVVFVLATTNPDSVLATIRSRTQHLRFTLVPGDAMVNHLSSVAASAGLQATHEQLVMAANRANGSVRDALSELDAITLASEAPASGPVALLSAIVRQDTHAMLVAVATAVREGANPRALAETMMSQLRDMFLIQMGTPDLVSSPDLGERDKLAAEAGPRFTVKAMNALAEAISSMRGEFDSRVNLEVSLCRLFASK